MKRMMNFLFLFVVVKNTAAQNVGIGAAAPFGKFQINHKGTVNTPALVLFDSAGSTGSEIRFVKQGITIASNFNMNASLTGVANTSFWKFNAPNNTPAMTINGNGHIYFGSGTPDYTGKFNLDGSVNFTSDILMNGNAGETGQPLITNGESPGGAQWYPNTFFLADGKVGIGTATPAAKLQINNRGTGTRPSLNLFDSTGGGGSNLTFSKQGFTGNMQIFSGITGNTPSGNSLNIQHSGGSPVLTIKGDGKIGINEESPSSSLEVRGTLKADTVRPFVLRLTPDAGDGKVLTSDAAGFASWEDKANANGSVGFGTWGDCSMNNLSEYNPVVDTAGRVFDLFGTSVSISGNYAIVGAEKDFGAIGGEQGSASIYQYNGTEWVLMQKITDATGGSFDHFGASVSISGNYAMVGAKWDDGGAGTDQGSVSIYQLTGGTWVLMQKITDVSGGAGDQFGYSVSISGNYAVAGAPFDNGAFGANQGTASIYQYNGTTWVLMQKLVDATGVADDSFGRSVSISGNYAIISAPFDDDAAGGADQGSASIFQLSGASWVLISKVFNLGPSAGDRFGMSVSISGDFAIVGAEGDDGIGGTDHGSACIFRNGGSSWSLIQKITDPNGLAGDFFVKSVSISGNYAVVGANQVNGAAGINQGSAIIYQRVGILWNKLQYITDPGAFANDEFGTSAAIDGVSRRFLTGAPGYAIESGKVVFGKFN